MEKANDELASHLEEELQKRQPSQHRIDLLQQLEAANELLAKLQAELAGYAELDPDLFVKRKAEAAAARQAANKWTENIYILAAHCNNVFQLPKADFEKQFEIPPELDYI